MDSHTFHVAESEQDFAAVRSLRQAQYTKHIGDTRWLDDPADAERDRVGFVYLLRQNGMPVASVRVVAASSDLAELHELGQMPETTSNDPHCCEVGRVVATGGSLSNSALIIACGTRWTVTNTPFERYIAYCRLPLVRLWQQFGALDTGCRFALPERQNAQYAVITGSLDDVAAATAELCADQYREVVSVA